MVQNTALQHIVFKCSELLSVVPLTVYVAYGAFMAWSWLIYAVVAEQRYSSIMTIASVLQCLGFVLLYHQIETYKSASGISARTLKLECFAICLRLSSTLIYQGYLPNDKSGDYVYQCIDLACLVAIIYLLRAILVTQRGTYDESDDDMRIGPLVVCSFILGFLLHGDMDDHPLFDSLWLTGHFISLTAMLPQYWLIVRRSGMTNALTMHYVATSGLSRILSGMFMWYVRRYITCSPWVSTFQHTINAILLAHFVHLVLMSDFVMFYFRTEILPLLIPPSSCGSESSSSCNSGVSFIDEPLQGYVYTVVL